MNMYYHRQKTTVGLSSLTLGNRSKTGFPTMMHHWLTTLLLFNRFLYCIVVQSNINYKLFELHCNCRSKCILFKLNNTIYIAWEKSHTSLLAMKMKVSLILRKKLYVHVFVAALQMNEVLSKYKSHPHSHIYFFKNDNLR